MVSNVFDTLPHEIVTEIFHRRFTAGEWVVLSGTLAKYQGPLFNERIPVAHLNRRLRRIAVPLVYRELEYGRWPPRSLGEDIARFEKLGELLDGVGAAVYTKSLSITGNGGPLEDYTPELLEQIAHQHRAMWAVIGRLPKLEYLSFTTADLYSPAPFFYLGRTHPRMRHISLSYSRVVRANFDWDEPPETPVVRMPELTSIALQFFSSRSRASFWAPMIMLAAVHSRTLRRISIEDSCSIRSRIAPHPLNTDDNRDSVDSSVSFIWDAAISWPCLEMLDFDLGSLHGARAFTVAPHPLPNPLPPAVLASLATVRMHSSFSFEHDGLFLLAPNVCHVVVEGFLHEHDARTAALALARLPLERLELSLADFTPELLTFLLNQLSHLLELRLGFTSAEPEEWQDWMEKYQQAFSHGKNLRSVYLHSTFDKVSTVSVEDVLDWLELPIGSFETPEQLTAEAVLRVNRHWLDVPSEPAERWHTHPEYRPCILAELIAAVCPKLREVWSFRKIQGLSFHSRGHVRCEVSRDPVGVLDVTEEWGPLQGWGMEMFERQRCFY